MARTVGECVRQPLAIPVNVFKFRRLGLDKSVRSIEWRYNTLVAGGKNAVPGQVVRLI